MDQVKTKIGFGYFFRFGNSALTLRLQNTYIEVFQAFFLSFQFQKLVLRVNTLTANYGYSRSNTESLPLPVEIE